MRTMTTGGTGLAVRLFLLQRLTAMILAPLVLIHVALIIYAVQDGLDTGEILARTRGSWFWAGFYGLFVIAAAVHAGIGLRNIVEESTSLPRRVVDLAAGAAALLLLILGLRAVAAVTAL